MDMDTDKVTLTDMETAMETCTVTDTIVSGHEHVLSNNVFGRFKQFGKFSKKSLNGHATVVGGHATVGRLSYNVFWRFKQLGKILKKVTERSRDSGRKSRDRRSVCWLRNRQNIAPVCVY